MSTEREEYLAGPRPWRWGTVVLLVGGAVAVLEAHYGKPWAESFAGLVLGAAFMLSALDGLRTNRVSFVIVRAGLSAHRYERPIRFWFFMCANALLGTVILCGVIGGLMGK